jgi:hypothetical protein
MGQNVEIRNRVIMGDVLMIDTDRSFTGQDGHTIAPGEDGEGVPGVLANRLFGLDLGIDHIFVLQNSVTVRRPGGWDDEAARAVTDVTHTFLRFYPDGEEIEETEAAASGGEPAAAESGEEE